MNVLGKEYSGRIEQLWQQLDPPPFVTVYPQRQLVRGPDPQYTGCHLYVPGSGDFIYLVHGQADEYTVAHELMHVILRRKGFPHCLCRFVDVEPSIVRKAAQALDSLTIHPILNRMLSQVGLPVPQAYKERLLIGLKRKFKTYPDTIKASPESLPEFAYPVLEIVALGFVSRDELPSELCRPEVLSLSDTFMEAAKGLEAASPQECQEFSLQVVRETDKILNQHFGRPSDLYFTNILFPPPPFGGNPDHPATELFDCGARNYPGHGWEVEVVSLRYKAPCWADGPYLEKEPVGDRYHYERLRMPHLSVREFAGYVRDKMLHLNAREFANFCDLCFVSGLEPDNPYGL